jgi:uncharacterized membrane protein YagU involved in acid resistance
MRKSLFAAAAIGGLIAGTVDIGAAALINLVDPVVVMHAIARGLIGQAAMTGGAATAVLGLVLQWLMSILIALIYALAALKLPVLVRRWPLMGLAYGVGVFLVMEYAVVPLSAVGKAPHFTPLSFALNMAAMLVFGLIVAFAASRDGLKLGVRNP